jgi:hypothetical protein
MGHYQTYYTCMKHGLTNGEAFLKRKPLRKFADWATLVFIAFLIFMAFMFWHYVRPLYFYPKVALLPVSNQESCQEIKEGRWSETYQVFKYCEQLTNS